MSSANPVDAVARGRAAYVRACELDVEVAKPGNVSRTSAGHRMDATMFVLSARASVDPLFVANARVGARIERSVSATWDAVGCNTNLGILLLCAPIARALETRPEAAGLDALHAAVVAELAGLDLEDTRAAYRGIARARPGGLGSAAAEDVHAAPSLDLRAAMALAADRDSIARQYRDGYRELFEACAATGAPAADAGGPAERTAATVHRVYLRFLATRPDSHIVRKHGEALAHSVMRAAQPWRDRSLAGEPLGDDPAFAAWDRELKAAGINPGTSADLTVAALMLANLAGGLPAA